MTTPDDGARALLERLAAPGAAKTSPADFEQLMEGIAAAPESLSGPEWLELVAPYVGEQGADDLLALRARLAAQPDGIADAIPPRARLDALRAELQRRGLDGFIVPRADEHQGEYVPRAALRLAWLTGFSGSAGWAIVLADKGAIFVDGRYTLQVRDQVDTTLFQPQAYPETTPADWLASNLTPGARFGFDPWLHGLADADRLAQACTKAGATLVAVDGNPIDAVWPDRPPPPLAPVLPQPLDLAGEAAETKRTRIAKLLADKGADAVLLTQPDSIAWLLNIRGGDVPRTPFALSFALLRKDGAVDLFIDQRKLTPMARAHLGNGVAVRPPEALGGALTTLGAEGATLWLDPATAPRWALDRLGAHAKVVRDMDPVALPKACKNDVELQGVRAAHKRDGAAVTRYLAWLAQTAAGGTVDEIAAATQLQQFRADTGALRDLSFDTISGAGANGAIVHYHPTPRTARKLTAGELYLVDSGAQYRDGTTDITRTVAIGTPSAEARDRFTRVLKGHIAIAMARFPVGTTGSQLDALARYHLWQVGLDYDHGTGHGVGAYLSVHEGPHRISKMANSVALRPGMIVSNEPGYYKAGAYGIRIENLVVVREAVIDGADRAYLEFETVTLAPIDVTCIEPSLLSEPERAWLNTYHARVREEVGQQVDAQARAWLDEATRPV
ncbi:aminopeptidase P family protein [Reyranella sp. CPCC 100927]|uniref:aminopeptidase P family protein n=1 Tax=Reyranella sp. CPCC 100927 TaxID=2599616 RepID=UPI002104360B|nr:aminopeptidase P family protein [Reyranella sp. CPCC 100927]